MGSLNDTKDNTHQAMVIYVSRPSLWQRTHTS